MSTAEELHRQFAAPGQPPLYALALIDIEAIAQSFVDEYRNYLSEIGYTYVSQSVRTEVRSVINHITSERSRSQRWSPYNPQTDPQVQMLERVYESI